MTTEEIDKATEEFCLKRRLDSRGYPPKVWFKAGAEFANKHWQEKTKWKSLKIEPPQSINRPFYIIIKHKHGGFEVRRYINKKSVDFMLAEGFIEWKEIE